MIISSLSYTYASAFLAQYRSQITPSMLETIQHVADKLHQKKSVLSFARLLEKEKEEVSSLAHTYFADKGLPQESWKSLINLLVEHKRLPIIASVLKAIILLYEKEEGLSPCHVSSSIELTDQQKKDVEQFIRNNMARKGTITYEIKTKLIAGLRIMTRDQLWEHSANKKLQRLRALIAREYGGY